MSKSRIQGPLLNKGSNSTLSSTSDTLSLSSAKRSVKPPISTFWCFVIFSVFAVLLTFVYIQTIAYQLSLNLTSVIFIRDDFLPIHRPSSSLSFHKPPLSTKSSFLSQWHPPSNDDGAIDPGQNGDYHHNTVELRRSLIKKFGSVYGCDSDPVVSAAKKPAGQFLSMSGGGIQTKGYRAKEDVALQNVAVPISGTFRAPPKIALLFLVSGNLKQSKVWSAWFREARHWSQNYVNNGTGPYRTTLRSSPPISVGASDASSPNTTTNTDRLDESKSDKLEEEASASQIEGDPLFTTYVHDYRMFRNEAGGMWESLLSLFKRPKEVQSPSEHIEEMRNGLVPSVPSQWGSLNFVEHQLLTHAIMEERNEAFIFISDSTVPVKPFHYIYTEFFRNPRSRFYFSNVNLPLVRKHHQWMILNRRHAEILLQHKEMWVCSKWLTQPFQYLSQKVWAAPDEYLPFHALSEAIGISSIQAEINDGSVYQYPIEDFDFRDVKMHSDSHFRHTWNCWLEDNDPCDLMGTMFIRRASPSEFYKVNADQFERLLLAHKDVWFARKFSSDCRIDFGNHTSEIPRTGISWNVKVFGIPLSTRMPDRRIAELPHFSEWLIDRLANWNEEQHLWG